ncbi:cobalt ECF transporter T component CbiQ [Spirochaetia bacterium]|nr:cobalt ECF transporter T component CbiQ [Spirochaetia bacterium]
MYLDRLEYKKDLLKSFDGRCRLLSGAFLIAALVCSKNDLVLAAAIGVSMVILFRELRVTFLRLIPVNMMAVALWLPVAFGTPIHTACIYTLRINAAAMMYMCFVIPMSISAIASSLTKLKAPDKLISLFILTYRYIFLLHDRFWTAQKSMRLRNTSYNDVGIWRSLSAVFSSSLVNAHLRGGKVWVAMLARGFDGSFPVTVLFHWRLRDTALLTISLLFSIVILCTN